MEPSGRLWASPRVGRERGGTTAWAEGTAKQPGPRCCAARRGAGVPRADRAEHHQTAMIGWVSRPSRPGEVSRPAARRGAPRWHSPHLVANGARNLTRLVVPSSPFARAARAEERKKSLTRRLAGLSCTHLDAEASGVLEGPQRLGGAEFWAYLPEHDPRSPGETARSAQRGARSWSKGHPASSSPMLGDRLMAGRRTLTPSIKVRILVPQLSLLLRRYVTKAEIERSRSGG